MLARTIKSLTDKAGKNKKAAELMTKSVTSILVILGLT